MKILRSLSTLTIGSLLLMVAFFVPIYLSTQQVTASAPPSSELSIALAEDNSGPMPDLVIESFTLQPTTPVVGEPVIATIRVRNQSNASASGGFRTHLYIDPDDQPPTTQTEDTHDWGYFVTFPADGEIEFEAEGYSFTESGCDHKIYAWIDRDNEMDESNEANNISELQICVSPTDPGSDDSYEPDNECQDAREIPTDGTAQTRYFRPDGDIDWVKFYATAGEVYSIAATGTGEEAWPEFELWEQALCQPQTFGGGTSRTDFTPPATGWYALRLENNLESYNPDESHYRLTVLGENTPPGIAPTIASLEPNSGMNDQNTNVTITGSDFHVTPLVELCPYEGASCQEGTAENPLCKQLLDTSWLSSQELYAIVPANLETGDYCLAATNPAGGHDILANAFTVLSGAPEVGRVLPNQSYNDLPNEINVYGFNFADGISVRLNGPESRELENLTIINRTHLRGTIPAGLQEGSYDLEAFYAQGEVATLSDAVTILQAEGDDLFAQADEFWVDPVSPHAGSVAQLALLVHREGGEATLSDVVVRFSVDGQVIGDATVSLLGPDSTQNSSWVSWTVPSTPGDYQLSAIIDPDNQLTETSDSNNTILKTVTVLEQATDTLPPRVDSLQINDGQDTVTKRDVLLDASATDFPQPGGTGVTQVRYIELEYSEGSRVWIPVQDSDWQEYGTSTADYAWTLSPASGIHYIQGWAKDAVGNISTFPNQASVNHLPPTGQVERNQTRLYRQDLSAGETLQVTLTPLSGDPDLYIWPPNWDEGNPPWVSNQEGNVDEILTFQAPISGSYQIEVYGYTAAEYQLSIQTSRLPFTASPSDCDPSKECRGQPALALDNAPPLIDPGNTPTQSFSLYLPSIIK